MLPLARHIRFLVLLTRDHHDTLSVAHVPRSRGQAEVGVCTPNELARARQAPGIRQRGNAPGVVDVLAAGDLGLLAGLCELQLGLGAIRRQAPLLVASDVQFPVQQEVLVVKARAGGESEARISIHCLHTEIMIHGQLQCTTPQAPVKLTSSLMGLSTVCQLHPHSFPEVPARGRQANSPVLQELHLPTALIGAGAEVEALRGVFQSAPELHFLARIGQMPGDIKHQGGVHPSDLSLSQKLELLRRIIFIGLVHWLVNASP
mmetsp:Transcript_125392/g.297702  ORF Transcript_125392/g.297702 Transcript_125392/m.297702 type:complete len:261 (+) Transcript_125392:1317-2099(+)